MKKILVTLMMVFGLSVAVFADVKLMPRNTFNNYFVPIFEDTAVQPLIAYYADTWEDVYEKTGVGKYGWRSMISGYIDYTGYQYFIIIKCEKNGYLGWFCLEYPGDGSGALYASAAY